MTRRGRIRLGCWGTLLLAGAGFFYYCTALPGQSYAGPLRPADPVLSQSLKSSVSHLSRDIGERHHYTYKAQKEGPAELEAAADWIESEFRQTGCEVARQSYALPGDAVKFANLVATRPGSAEVVVVGAHYDSIPTTPGADDNASGVAVLLELARHFRGGGRTVRFVAFTNEEPVYFQTEQMGSLVYARECKARGDQVVAMLSLETLGYYKNEPGTQKYPFPLGLLYPNRGNFVGFVSNLPSRGLNHRVISLFRNNAEFPSQGACLPEFIPGVSWSDHWSFGQVGYPSVMVTDTAPFRNPNYHQSTDTADTLDYDCMARVTLGLQRVLEELAGPSPK